MFQWTQGWTKAGGDGRRVGENGCSLPVLLTYLPSPFCNPCSTVLLLSLVYFQNFLSSSTVPKAYEHSCMSLPLKANKQKAEATAALSWISLHPPSQPSSRRTALPALFHFLTPPSSLSVPLPGSYLRKVSHKSHERPPCLQNQYPSQLRRPLWGRRHPYFLLSESLPAPGLGDAVFCWVFFTILTFSSQLQLFVFCVLFLHFLPKHWYSLGS